MIDLIGKPYELGSDGSGGPIDCIHLVYTVLKRLGIETPPFNPGWYEASQFSICRDLLRWGVRVERPTYDGDVVLIPQAPTAFAVTWQNGILYINKHSQRVSWCPLHAMPPCPCFRTRSS